MSKKYKIVFWQDKNDIQKLKIILWSLKINPQSQKMQE